jgi:hypothetical protein
VRTPLFLLGLSLALQALFWLATPDRTLVHSIGYQGDACEWQRLAAIASAGADDELFRLPLRPPAMQWLVAMLWDGDPATAWRVRAVFLLIGASIAPLAFLAVRRTHGGRVALFTASFCALATNLWLCAAGPHSESLYLAGFLLSLLDQDGLRTRPAALTALRWGCLHGLLCLLRAEHALCFVSLVLLLVVQRAPRCGRTALLATLAAAAAVLPWQVHAASLVERYNATGTAAPAPGERLPPGALRWHDDALARVRALPAFQQQPVFWFVNDTVRARGGAAVGASDLGVVEEAYGEGTWPEPIRSGFVAIYGGLNFFLGNSPEAAGGFSNEALLRPPPLHGGAERYPPGLANVLPRELTLSYPPHLAAVNHGYRLGLDWLADHPSAALSLAWRKLVHFARGALTGLGGYAVPMGLSGTRARVDFVTADGPIATAWRSCLLILALLGLASAVRQPGSWPWLLWAFTKIATALCFFGYARQGALCVPVVALGIGLLGARLPPRAGRLGLGLLLLFVLVEIARTIAAPAITIDGEALSDARHGAADYSIREVAYR